MAEGVFGDECVQGHTALIYDRGGKTRVAKLVDLSKVKWGRTRNGVSDAEVLISGRACEGQAEVLSKIHPRRHELVIYRGAERVWEGPIIQATSTTGLTSIVAKDVGDYLRGTALSKAWPGPDAGGPPLMTDRIEQIIEWELAQPYTVTVGTGGAAHSVTMPRWEGLTPPANILPFLEVRPGTVLTRSSTQAFEMTVWDHLSNLVRSGVDMTTVGRKILVWDTAEALGRTRTLTEADFYGNPEVILSGSEFAAIFHVVPQQDESATGVAGNAGDVDPYYGVWTMVHTADSEGNEEGTPDQWALNSQAQRGLLGRNPVPVEVRLPDSAGLRVSHDLTIQMLVPGIEMPLLAQFGERRLSQMQILDRMTVEETPAGENISVTLVPSAAAAAVGVL
jgi:hypothetical protein